MSVVVYRDGVMASDSGAWRGDSVIPWARKIARGPDGTLYGGAGDYGGVSEFLAWVDGGGEGERPHPEPGDGGRDYSVVIVSPDGRLTMLGPNGEEPFTAPYFAVGAGSAVCLGALHVGASAEDAVRAALTHADGARGAVQVVRR